MNRGLKILRIPSPNPMANWHTINTIVGPCRCGMGCLKSIHLTDGNGNYDTVWSLDCPACRSKYDLVESKLVGNPDKAIAMIQYVPKKVQSLLKQTAQAMTAQITDNAQTATSKVTSAPSA